MSMNIDTNRINCCTVGDYYFKFDDSFKKWKQAHQNCTIVHMQQTQDDKFIVVTIWYKERYIMGEARRRGNFEERKKFSILKQEKKRLEDKLKEEKNQYIKRNKSTNFFFNIALSLLSD